MSNNNKNYNNNNKDPPSWLRKKMRARLFRSCTFAERTPAICTCSPGDLELAVDLARNNNNNNNNNKRPPSRWH